MNKTTEETFASIHPHNIALLDEYHCTTGTFLFSYTQTYNDNISQAIYLEKLAVLPV